MAESELVPQVVADALEYVRDIGEDPRGMTLRDILISWGDNCADDYAEHTDEERADMVAQMTGHVYTLSSIDAMLGEPYYREQYPEIGGTR